MVKSTSVTVSVNIRPLSNSEPDEATAGAVLEQIAASWYGCQPDESAGDGYYFHRSQVCVTPGSYDEVSKVVYKAVPAFIAELTGTEHGL